MTDDPVGRLKAGLDADEAAANAAASVAGPDWAWHTEVTLDDEVTDYVTGADGAFLADTMGGTEDVAPHAARQDPARTLREVAANREILAAHSPDPVGKFGSIERPRCRVCLTDRGGYEEQWEADDWPCATVLALAAVYGDDDI